jgi:hypothetical protein
MDILNIISWVKGKRQVTSVDPTKSLIPVAQKDDRRDDGYLTGVISVEDLLASTPAPPSLFAVNGNSIYTLTPPATPLDNRYNIAFGSSAGAYSSSSCVSIGEGAGANSNFAVVSNFIGQSAGNRASEVNACNFIGIRAGEDSGGSIHSNFIGFEAGVRADNVNYSTFIGLNAGTQASYAGNSIFIGQYAGLNAINAYNSNFLGEEAGRNSTGNNVNAFGFQAHKGGTLSGQTVFSNSSLKSYLNRATAVAAITVPLGASAGSTYLYYNQTTFAIEAVRL